MYMEKDTKEHTDQPPQTTASPYTETEVVADTIGRLLDASLLKRTPEAIRSAADVCGVSIREVRDSYRAIVDVTRARRPRSTPVRLPAGVVEPVKTDVPTTPAIAEHVPLVETEQDSGINVI